MKLDSALKVLAATSLIAVALAGCLEPAKSTGYHAYATGGKFAYDFAYDGKGVTKIDAPAFIDVNDAANTGVFAVKGKVGGLGDVLILFDAFSQAADKPFQDGGIRANLVEHGDSGVGDTLLPKVDMSMAGWGTANITIGGKLMKDPIGNSDRWMAHFMVIRNGVRDNTSGAIWADANKSKAYDPAMPGMGYSEKGDDEVHLIVRSAAGNATSPVTYGPVPTGMVQPSPTFSATHNLFTVEKVPSAVSVDMRVGGQAFTASNLSFSIRSPSGQVFTQSLGPNTPPVASTTSYTKVVNFVASEPGQYTASVTGRLAAGNTYSIRGSVTPPASVIMYLWWEDVVFGADAEVQGETVLSGVPHTH